MDIVTATHDNYSLPPIDLTKDSGYLSDLPQQLQQQQLNNES